MKFTKDEIIEALKMVFDPEIPVNVWDLGLIYNVECRMLNDELNDKSTNSTFNIQHSTLVKVRMTLTSPTCPMAEELVQMVKQAGESVAGPGNVHVELVWDPPWAIDRMSPTARLELDLTEEGW